MPIFTKTITMQRTNKVSVTQWVERCFQGGDLFNSHIRFVVESLDKMLHDDYLCLMVSLQATN